MRAFSRRVAIAAVSVSLVVTGLLSPGSLLRRAGASNLNGDFHLQCPAIKVDTIDPVKYGTGGTVSHVHIFFANGTIASNSTDTSLNSSDGSTGASNTTCNAFEDPTGVKPGYTNVATDCSQYPNTPKTCADLAAYWQPIAYMCSTGVRSWTAQSTNYKYDSFGNAADPLADTQADCGGGDGTGIGGPCASSSLVSSIGANCDYFSGSGPTSGLSTGSGFPTPFARAYYDAEGFGTLAPFQSDGTNKPNIIAGFSGGDGLDNSYNVVSPSGGSYTATSIGLSPLGFAGPPGATYGLPVLRFDCGAFSGYSSPETNRPYDCDWAREDCYFRMQGNTNFPPADNTSCDNSIQGLVVMVFFPQCWGNSNAYASGTQDSSQHFAYGSGIGSLGASCSGVTDAAGDTGTYADMPTLSIRYHTAIADPCYGDGATGITPDSADVHCAPDVSQLQDLKTQDLGYWDTICQDTLSTLPAPEKCSASGPVVTTQGTGSFIDKALRIGVAGKDGTTLDIHAYWTAHADFMDAWGSNLLTDLVQQCNNGHSGASPCGNLT